MQEYYKQFGINALANCFNQIAKQENDLYRAELIAKVEVL
jgi:hypothetical protein